MIRPAESQVYEVAGTSSTTRSVSCLGQHGIGRPSHRRPVGAENLRHLGRYLGDVVGSVTRTVPGGQVWVRAGVR